MQVNDYSEYARVRDELLERGIDGELTVEAAGEAIGKIDLDNREFFEQFIDISKENAFDLYRQGFMSAEVLESVIDEIDSYAMPILQADDFATVQYNAMLERADAIRSALYRECANGTININQREAVLGRVNELVEECTSVDDLEERLGVVSEGFIEDTKSKIGKIAPGMLSVKFKGKVMNLKCVVKDGIDLKTIKEKYNGLDLKTTDKVVSDIGKLLRKEGDKIIHSKAAASVATKINKYLDRSDEEIFNDLKAKYISTNGKIFEVMCTHPMLAPTHTIGVKFTSSGKYTSYQYGGKDSMLESVLDTIDELM